MGTGIAIGYIVLYVSYGREVSEKLIDEVNSESSDMKVDINGEDAEQIVKVVGTVKFYSNSH